MIVKMSGGINILIYKYCIIFVVQPHPQEQYFQESPLWLPKGFLGKLDPGDGEMTKYIVAQDVWTLSLKKKTFDPRMSYTNAVWRIL